MRVIAGTLKGQQFQSPHNKRTHPMSDKARGALFNVLGDIDGLTFLDAFAGSGALAFEAVSRGAKNVVAIDKDTAAHRVLEHNVKDLRLSSQIKAVKANSAGWSLHNAERKFNIVLLAPPYDDLQEKLVKKLARRHVAKNGLVVLDWPGKLDPLVLDDFKIELIKNYGDAQLIFYRK